MKHCLRLGPRQRKQALSSALLPPLFRGFGGTDKFADFEAKTSGGAASSPLKAARTSARIYRGATCRAASGVRVPLVCSQPASERAFAHPLD